VLWARISRSQKSRNSRCLSLLEREGRSGVAAFGWNNPPFGHNVDEAFSIAREKRKQLSLAWTVAKKPYLANKGWN
jgi:hypothetical protein